MTDTDFEPFDAMTRQNLELIRDISGPAFDGDSRLDPTLNGALAHLHRADELIALYRQGAFPLAHAGDFVSTTRQLLALCRSRYGIAAVKPMEQAFFGHFALWNYEGPPLHPPELFAKKLFEAEERLLAAICTANVRIATLEAPKPGKTRKGRSYGDRDAALHRERAEIVAAIRRKREATGLSWPRCVRLVRQSAYAARMRGRTDATWVRYAKSGFSG